ncbi:MAG: WYL domain-containing protein [Bacteroidales bacterium]|nr:WYL domain-containing protein [Bacteroidales bacterium]
MPTNKNAVIRYQILDELLSDKNHYYTRKNLLKKCNEKLLSRGYEEVIKRTIEKDLHDMEEIFPDIEIDWEYVRDGKQIIRYVDQSRSIFTKKLTYEEFLFLNEVLNTLGQFSGLDNFEWLDSLQTRLHDKFCKGLGCGDERTAIMRFSKNPFLNNGEGMSVNNILAGLFAAIANKVVVSVEYKKFGEQDSDIFTVSPYLLRQYNDRWYLICELVERERDFLMNLPLDRILSFKEEPGITFQDCFCDIDERFEDIVGVTYYDDVSVETILFALPKHEASYIDTKPIHGSQKLLSADKQREYKALYPQLEDYVFYTVDCIPNNELYEVFFSFNMGIVVLHKDIQQKMCDEMEKQLSIYKGIRLP